MPRSQPSHRRVTHFSRVSWCADREDREEAEGEQTRARRVGLFPIVRPANNNSNNILPHPGAGTNGSTRDWLGGRQGRREGYKDNPGGVGRRTCNRRMTRWRFSSFFFDQTLQRTSLARQLKRTMRRRMEGGHEIWAALALGCGLRNDLGLGGAKCATYLGGGGWGRTTDMTTSIFLF